MNLGKNRPLSIAEIAVRIIPVVAFAISLASVFSGCGVRQFGANLPKPAGPVTPGALNGYGPFYASGQGNGTMSTAACAAGPGHHPCARVRASVGMPYQFDVNPNTVQGPVTAGVNYSAPAPYAGIAGAAGLGAGKTTASAGKPQLGNRDLHLLQGQTAVPAQSF